MAREPEKRPAPQLLEAEAVFLNVGVREFAESLRAQGADVLHVQWMPPAGGDEEAAALLERLL